MSPCQRQILTVFCARTGLIGEMGPVQMTKKKSSSTKCKWRQFRLGTSGKIVKVDIMKSMNVRFISTKAKTVTAPSQSSTFLYLLKWGMATLLVTAFVSSTVVWWELWSLRRNMSSVTSVWTGTPVESFDLLPTFSDLPPVKLLRTFFFNYESNTRDGSDHVVWFPWLQAKSQDPFTLLELCRSNNTLVRHLGVAAMASKTAWDDYQYRYVAQAADYCTLIGLSRSAGADSRFFLKQPDLIHKQTPLSEELASLLLLLDQHQAGNSSTSGSSSSRSSGDSSRGSSSSSKKKSSREPTELHSRAAVLAHQYIHHKNRPTDDKIRFWGFDGSSLDVASVDGPIPEDKMLLQFLAAMARMCCSGEHAGLFVGRGGLGMLQRVCHDHQSTEFFTAVATVLGNLALHAPLHQAIVQAGWLGILKSWTEGSNSRLATRAACVLHNMDRDWTSDRLDHGLLILHPFHRSRKTVHADLVFVHGLLGGGVKTWRQQDAAYQAAGPKSGRTDCWPKDWLAEDCPQVRILSVHFDSALSSWSSSDTNTRDRSTLEGRSQELLEKLHTAGVGQRPIIWVGHSMGGLLIKQMLELSERVPRYSHLRQQTCGLLLYSVPHRGLSIAHLTSLIHYLLYPSTEVQELKADSDHLRRLHEHFVQFVEGEGIPCLSFGEQLKTQLGKTLPRVWLVPPHSSDPGTGDYFLVPQSHINICKPESRESELYQQSLSFLHRCIFFSYVARIRKGVSGTLE